MSSTTWSIQTVRMSTLYLLPIESWHGYTINSICIDSRLAEGVRSLVKALIVASRLGRGEEECIRG